MTPSQVNPTPKDRFQESEENRKAHHELLNLRSFQRAEDMALAHYIRILTVVLGKSSNPQVDGMVNAWKIAGVHEFLSELRNLAEKPMASQAPGIARTLDHQN